MGRVARACRWCPTSTSCHPLSPYFPDTTACDNVIPGDVGPNRRRARRGKMQNATAPTAASSSSSRDRRSHWMAADYFLSSVRDPDYCPANVQGAPFFASATAEIAGANPAQRNYGVAITDVDGDGLFDAVVAGYNGPNAVLSSDGNVQ